MTFRKRTKKAVSSAVFGRSHRQTLQEYSALIEEQRKKVLDMLNKYDLDDEPTFQQLRQFSVNFTSVQVKEVFFIAELRAAVYENHQKEYEEDIKSKILGKVLTNNKRESAFLSL